MAIKGEYTIAAPRDQVWAALNDPTVLQACIPGCESLTKQSDTQIDARITAQLGPIRSTFATRIVLSELDPPNGYTLSGEGKGVAGFGRGSAKVSLSDAASGSLLRYDAQLSIGGKLAQIGSRLVEAATRSYADQFFEAFAQRLNSPAGADPDAANASDGAVDAPPPVDRRIGARWGWWPYAAAAIVALILWKTLH